MTGEQRLGHRAGVPVAVVVALTSIAVLVLGDSDVAIPAPAAVVGIGLVALVVIAVATAFEFRGQHPFPVSSLLRRLALLGLAFGLGGLLWAVRDPEPAEVRGGDSDTATTPTETVPTETAPTEPARSTGAGSFDAELMIAVLLGLAVLGLLIWLIWDHRRRARRVLATSGAPRLADTDDAANQHERQRRAVREGLRRGRGALLAEDDPRRGVIRAYVAFERHVRGQGLIRGPTETQREFATRVLADGGLDVDRVRPLVELFNVARFSELPVTPADAQQAREHIDAMVGA
jgi:hypothetical protein